MILRLINFATRSSLAVMLVCGSFAAHAQDIPLSIRNSFRIGSSGVICTAQISSSDSRLSDIFDRAYQLSCRDAADAIGNVIATRRPLTLATEPLSVAIGSVVCRDDVPTLIEGLGLVQTATCEDTTAIVDYRRYMFLDGNKAYLVEGLAGYDPALRLALASVVLDAEQSGEIRVAMTEVSDAAAFARVQAGLFSVSDARQEAYARNNSGRFGEAAEFFDSIVSRDDADPAALAEMTANQGLQQSNLSNFAAAARLFDLAAENAPLGDGIFQRLLRNYRAMNALNQRQPDLALEFLDAPVVAPVSVHEQSIDEGYISPPIAEQINRENIALGRLSRVNSGLTDQERAEILDGQRNALAGIAFRQKNNLDDAARLLAAGLEQVRAVRAGRLVSTTRLRTDILLEQALVAEAQGSGEEALAAYDQGIAALERSFALTPALLAAKARKAAFLGRQGNVSEAIALFDAVVTESLEVGDSGASLRELLSPYFALLAQSGTPESAASIFRAAQIFQRPGVAETQAVLARELSEGNDEAAALFRLSVTRSREIVRTMAEVDRLAGMDNRTAAHEARLAALRETQSILEREQTQLVARLTAFPRYNVLAQQRVEMSQLQASLQNGEAYYKVVVLGTDVYGLFIERESARFFPVAGGLAELDEDVAVVRDSIVRTEAGQSVVEPFNAETARALYVKLFAPVDQEIRTVRHLIFDPDGPMLQLPPSVLVMDDQGLAAYVQRVESPDADAYDLRGLAWLGRGREISTAVSPRSFLEIRALGRSRASRAYLGLGANARPSAMTPISSADGCSWPLSVWQNPISPAELQFANSILGGDVRIEEQFTDVAILADDRLDQYRMLHFATHGLVAAPRPGCAAEPALVTSFGAAGSDGLLSFREIFDLRLDADLVILSACDTAGGATINASRAAGLSTGGNYAMDGLVRAFVGAGARSVMASLWPVPDDFNATQRLIGRIIASQANESVAHSLASAQEALMNDVNTSHPFYWAAFIIMGDGARPWTASLSAEVAAASQLPGVALQLR